MLMATTVQISVFQLLIAQVIPFIAFVQVLFGAHPLILVIP